MDSLEIDRYLYNDRFMNLAIREARFAEKEGNIPFGAVLVKNDTVISTGHNQRNLSGAATDHAEVICIQKALQTYQNLNNCTLYTTHMPCNMCAGMIVQFGIIKVISADSKTFPHARWVLELSEVEVVDLDLDEVRQLLENFVKRNKKVWEGTAIENNPNSEYLDKKPEVIFETRIGDKNNFIYVPYREDRYVNFYQYPPANNKYELDLDLDQRIIGGPNKFTIFISIPFCKQKCNSCPFFKNLLPKNKSQTETLESYLELILNQLEFFSKTKRYSEATCSSVYIGGGTASLLSSNQVKKLILKIKKWFNLKEEVEITLEGNPSDLTEKYLKDIRSYVSRVSIGYQSSHVGTLQTVNTLHNSKDGNLAIKKAIKWIGKVNIDLLYAVPDQTLKEWKNDLQKVINLNPTNITIYKYKILANSKLEKLIKNGEKEIISFEETYNWYFWATQELIKAGYHEGRFGNFSKCKEDIQRYGWHSYNVGYECIGIGAGAYGLINRRIVKNENKIQSFEEKIKKKKYGIYDLTSKLISDKENNKRFLLHNLFASKIPRNLVDPFMEYSELFAKFLRYKLIEVSKEEVILTQLGKKFLNNMLFDLYHA